MSGQTRLAIEGVTHRFGRVTALDSVSLAIEECELVTLLGPSGCGKTTLLRIIAGFINPSEGRVIVEGRDVTGVPPHKRPVNMVFQRAALFPHLDVRANVAFGLQVAGIRGEEAAGRATLQNKASVKGVVRSIADALKSDAATTPDRADGQPQT